MPLPRMPQDKTASEIFTELCEIVEHTRPDLAAEFRVLWDGLPSQIGDFLDINFPIKGGWLQIELWDAPVRLRRLLGAATSDFD